MAAEGTSSTTRRSLLQSVFVSAVDSYMLAVRAESAGSVSIRQVCSFLMGFGLHVTGNVNKTAVVDAEIAGQSERKAQQEPFAYDELRGGRL